MKNACRALWNRRSNQAVTGKLCSLLWVRGEISNFGQRGFGTIGILVKDEQVQVRGVMFRHKNRASDIDVGNGVQVEAQVIATSHEACVIFS